MTRTTFMTPPAHPFRLLTLADLPKSMQDWLLLAVAVAATAFVLFRSKAKTKKDPLTQAPFKAGLAQQRSTERQMQNLLVELAEMARQITASLDTRATKLDLLIREADEKIAVLQSLEAGRSVSSINDSRNGAARELPSQITSPPQISPKSSPQSSPQNSPLISSAAISAPVMSAPSPYDPDPRHAIIYALADQGRTPDQIAEELSRPNGEIQLILALRPRV